MNIGGNPASSHLTASAQHMSGRFFVYFNIEIAL